MTIGTDSAGGYAVPEILENRSTRRLAELSPICQVARILTPNTAFSSYKISVSLGGTAFGWGGEMASRTDPTPPVLNAPSFSDGEIYAMPKVSEWILDDWGSGQLEDLLAEEVSDEFATQEGSAFISGNGTDKPTGFLNTAPVSTDDDASPQRAFGTLQYVLLDLSSPSTTIEADRLIELAHTLKSGYWANATFCMNRAALSVARKLKDDQSQYLWSPGLASGTSNTLLGFPVLLVDSMGSIAEPASSPLTCTHPVAFGD
jgi:HK97 family phage major capsid protein